MKQSFYAIGMLILFVYGQASAQTTETSFMTKSAVINSPFVAKDKVAAPAASVKITGSAVDNFRKDFRDAKNVEWIQVASGYRAYFLDNAVLTAVDYTKKGKLYSIIRYGLDLLTTDMKAMIADNFDEPAIREVSEVKIADFATKAYVIVLEDRTSIKTVQIIDDEMSVISEVKK